MERVRVEEGVPQLEVARHLRRQRVALSGAHSWKHICGEDQALDRFFLVHPVYDTLTG